MRKQAAAEMVSAMGSAAKDAGHAEPQPWHQQNQRNQQKHLAQQGEKGWPFWPPPRATKVFWLAVCRANRKVSRKKMRSMGTAVASRSGSLLNTEMIWGMNSWISPQATTGIGQAGAGQEPVALAHPAVGAAP